MSNEEFERKMAFIVEQQAQFTVDIERLREVHAQTENVVERLANVTLDGFSATFEGFRDVNSKIDALVDSQITLTDSHKRMNDSHIRLADSQAQTDEKLRKLVTTVDRYLSENRNGN